MAHAIPYHCVPSVKVESLSDLAAKLAQVGFRPVFHDAQQAVAQKLSPWGLQALGLATASRTLEIFISAESASAICVRLLRTGRTKSGAVLDILSLAQDTPGLSSTATEQLPGPVIPHSWITQFGIDRIEPMAGARSPNGRILADKAKRAKIRKLYDDAARGALNRIISTFGDNPTPRDALKQLDESDDGAGLDKVFDDPQFMTKHFAIACPSCGTSHLSFKEAAAAQSAISSSEQRCAQCGHRGLEIRETYAVADPYVRTLKQGLWLESLASDVVGRYAARTWTGQMLGSIEVDVVAVVDDVITLIECKDTSFGQNDLYVTAVKAQQVAAELVVVVTTRAVHENVRMELNRMDGSTPDRTFYLLQEETAAAIAGKLEAILKHLTTDRVGRWLSSVSSTSSIWTGGGIAQGVTTDWDRLSDLGQVLYFSGHGSTGTAQRKLLPPELRTPDSAAPSAEPGTGETAT